MIARDWLEQINEELSRENVPIHRRDVEAVMRWQRETGERKEIFEGYPEVYAFFAAMISPQNPLAEYRGLFFFGGEFRPLNFPMTFGAVSIDIGYVIAEMGMPEAEAKRLMTDRQSRRELGSMIGSVLDWVYGFPRLGSSDHPTFTDENLAAADRHLRGAVEILLCERNRSRSGSVIMSTHALENVLKAFLAHHAGLDEPGAIKLSHDLGKILAKALKSPGSSELAELKEPLKLYPNVIEDRYKQVDYPDALLWHTYRWAQFGAAAVARSVNPGLNISDTILSASPFA